MKASELPYNPVPNQLYDNVVMTAGTDTTLVPLTQLRDMVGYPYPRTFGRAFITRQTIKNVSAGGSSFYRGDGLYELIGLPSITSERNDLATPEMMLYWVQKPSASSNTSSNPKVYWASQLTDMPRRSVSGFTRRFVRVGSMSMDGTVTLNDFDNAYFAFFRPRPWT